MEKPSHTITLQYATGTYQSDLLDRTHKKKIMIAFFVPNVLSQLYAVPLTGFKTYQNYMKVFLQGLAFDLAFPNHKQLQMDPIFNKEKRNHMKQDSFLLDHINFLANEFVFSEIKKQQLDRADLASTILWIQANEFPNKVLERY